MLRFLSIILLCVVTQTVFGQIDQEFWFAAPEVTSQHADRPILLRITSFDQKAEVKIHVPAMNGLQPKVVELEANDHLSVDLTEWILFLENSTPNIVSNRGLHIESSSPITAYYEVKGTVGGNVNNTDIFSLKGSNGEGTTFYTPFQNQNFRQTGINAFASFDIVATADSTDVTIILANDVQGYNKGDTVNIVLNKGQTYSMRSAGTTQPFSMHGTFITASKPICVTTKDDSVIHFQNWDLIGDQLIPVDKTGKEYIIKDDWAFILATEDGTTVQVNGGEQSIQLNAGQQDTCQIDFGIPFQIHHNFAGQ